MPGVEPTRRRVWLVGIILAGVVAAILGSGYAVYRVHLRETLASAYERLDAIARLQTAQVARYRQERLGDGIVLSENAVLAWRAASYLAGKEVALNEQALRAALRGRVVAYRYLSGMLVDTTGQMRLSAGKSCGFQEPDVVRTLRQAIQEERPLLTDLYWCKHCQSPHLTVVAPLIQREGQGRRVAAAMLFSMDSAKEIYPLLQVPVVASTTGETLLVRREGEEVLFLNELRYRKGTAMQLRLPISQADLPAAAAARGEVGPFEGRDYRGVPVLAAIRRVPKSTWRVVAKMDRAEVEAPLRREGVLLGITVTLLIASTFLMAHVLWSHQRAEHLRREAEERRQRLELLARYEALMQGANDIILVHDAQGRILEANERAVQAYGYPREELIGLNVEALRGSDRDTTLQDRLDSAEELDGIVWESVHRRKNGTLFPVEVSLRAVRAEGGPIFERIIRDITERKRAEEELRDTCRALALLSECNQILVRTTEESAFLRETCEAMVTIGGYRAAWIGLIEEDNASRVIPVAWSGVRDERLQEAAIAWEESDPQRAFAAALQRRELAIAPLAPEDPLFGTWPEATIAIALPLLGNGRLLGVLCFYAQASDTPGPQEQRILRELADDVAYGITALRTRAAHARMEAELLETNAQLEQALSELRSTQQQVVRQERLRALGQMASGIAHDFNNKLQPILTFTELPLVQPQVLSDPERLRTMLERAHQAALAASDVVKRLRSFYREPSDTDVFVPVDLNQVVRDAISLSEPRWRDQALAKGVVITVQTDLGEIPKVAGIESELREALFNLIINAVDAMPQGGTLTIRTKAEEPSSEMPTPHVVLEVSDTGIGMDEDTLRRCLDPFFTTKGEQGTGLGLSVVYGVVQRHSGTVHVHSAVGQGTTFTLHLPVRNQLERAAARQTHAFPTRSLRILVADDEESVRSAIVESLLADGHQPTAVADGVEAMERCLKESFDVVITDRAMPRLHGDELAMWIKGRWPHVPVIMLTGFGDLMQVQRERPAGVDFCLSKPVTREQLRQALAQVLGR